MEKIGVLTASAYERELSDKFSHLQACFADGHEEKNVHVSARQYEVIESVRMPGLAGLTALVVDDSEASREVLAAMLSTLGMGHVHVASDGLEALHMLTCSTPPVDMVLCDWNMPEISGLELLTQLRRSDKKMPFVMISGMVDSFSVASAATAGASAYLAKPYSPGRLARVLAKVVADL